MIHKKNNNNFDERLKILDHGRKCAEKVDCERSATRHIRQLPEHTASCKKCRRRSNNYGKERENCCWYQKQGLLPSKRRLRCLSRTVGTFTSVSCYSGVGLSMWLSLSLLLPIVFNDCVHQNPILFFAYH